MSYFLNITQSSIKLFLGYPSTRRTTVVDKKLSNKSVPQETASGVIGWFHSKIKLSKNASKRLARKLIVSSDNPCTPSQKRDCDRCRKRAKVVLRPRKSSSPSNALSCLPGTLEFWPPHVMRLLFYRFASGISYWKRVERHVVTDGHVHITWQGLPVQCRKRKGPSRGVVDKESNFGLNWGRSEVERGGSLVQLLVFNEGKLVLS